MPPSHAPTPAPSKQVPEIDEDSRQRMERFFKWMAYFLVGRGMACKANWLRGNIIVLDCLCLAAW